MATAILGEEIRIILELKNGTTLMGYAIVSELTIENSFSGLSSWSFAAQGTGAPIFEQRRQERIQQVRKERTAREWKCDRCGAVWPSQVNHCTACGFYRPFMYE